PSSQAIPFSRNGSCVLRGRTRPATPTPGACALPGHHEERPPSLFGHSARLLWCYPTDTSSLLLRVSPGSLLPELRQDLRLELVLGEVPEASATGRESIAEDLARPVELAADLILGLTEDAADLLVRQVAD